MPKHDDGGPAFPSDKGMDGTIIWPPHPGMTLLDWFAARYAEAAAREIPMHWGSPEMEKARAIYCYDAAEAMLAEKRRREQGD